MAKNNINNIFVRGQFNLISKFKPAGDQPEAIKQLLNGIKINQKHQVLLGVTGSGKTFTIANVIQKINKPTLVISHNKTLAAQVYSEFKAFFPDNAVEYFISYYDYYQPESYIPQTDTYIEKDASINEHIDRLRIKTTTSLLSRTDVIVVASVSSIYNLGSPEDFKEMCVVLEKGKTVNRNFLLNELINIHYERNDIEFIRGKFRVRGDLIDIFPANSETAIRVEFFGDEIEKITEINPLTGHSIAPSHYPTISRYFIYPAKHFVTPRPQLEKAVEEIRRELKERIQYFKKEGKLLEAQRIEQRTNYDIEMMLELGYCHGIENYSRHLSGRKPGSRPECLIDYFPKDFLTVIDESHVTIPQINGMYKGDKARKETLIDFGFRLPSALDNRPQKLEEFESLVDNVIYMSATPSEYELKKSRGAIVEQIVRPTGLIDPEVVVKPVENQIDDLISEIEKCVIKKERVLVTTLTKKMAEDLAEYLFEKKIKVKYLHSGIQALERIEILSDLRKGNFDVLVGVNLLREGLDLPEVSLVAVLDADKEGFLRSETSLIQVSGRAARNINGKVILYAETVTGSMKRALAEMNRRRKKQVAYNIKHNIKPKSIIKAIEELQEFQYKATKDSLSLLREDWVKYAQKKNIPELIRELEKEMNDAADNLNFEVAAILRDKIFELKEMSVKK
ncbi:MAG: excinuclease ABC subunit B [Elusimicrobia bacterium RIFOXYD2_FULL_34_15]|nr:MAG: excinuclease ABC subunit B [Elusimicrobia bacterium RIFOXYD2_FULL_34_15]